MGLSKLDFDCETCETNWLLGAAGKCNREQQLCICPDGFSGKDDIVVTQTCHVHEEYVNILHLVCFIAAMLATLVNIRCLFLLWKKYKSRRLEQNAEERKLRRITLAAMACGVFFCLGFAIGYAIFFFNEGKQSMVDQRNTAPFFFGIGQLFFVWTLVLILFAWFNSLPNPEIYGSLLGYSPFIIKHWQRLNALYIGGGIVWNVCIIVSYFILPLFDDKNDYMYRSVFITLFSTLLGVMFLIVLMLVTISSLLKLYRRALNLALRKNEVGNQFGSAASSMDFNPMAREKNKLEGIVSSLKAQRKIALGLLLTSMTFLSLNIIFGGLFQYVFVTGSCLLFFIGSCFGPFNVVKRSVTKSFSIHFFRVVAFD